jgi:hypothetical protein
MRRDIHADKERIPLPSSGIDTASSGVSRLGQITSEGPPLLSKLAGQLLAEAEESLSVRG